MCDYGKWHNHCQVIVEVNVTVEIKSPLHVGSLDCPRKYDLTNHFLLT